MNRRYFLGAGLALTSIPAWAKSDTARNAAPRTLSLHHLHTDERLSVTYRVGDHYQRSALQRLNHFLRDFRSGDTIAIDPRIYDLLFDVQHRLGGDGAVFEIISGYRSAQTNTMLRRASSGVARKSLHMSGKAIDVRLADMPTRSIRDAAVALAKGGVGYYPKSDFVHLDTGRVRRWGA
ncbi:MAG: DUF882 domain-containing protein [Thiohalocapsa sp.]|nr:DUF882 domain-containing protein [Thiohalocapsa sp.]MCF7989001.1 DUF882 domain-containing protein [Thiohalocapsa sp.]